MSRATAIVLFRGAVITIGVTLFCTAVIMMLMRLPKEPLLRACTLFLPFLAGVTVAGAWYESGAPWPKIQLPFRLPRAFPSPSPTLESKTQAHHHGRRHPASVL